MRKKISTLALVAISSVSAMLITQSPKESKANILRRVFGIFTTSGNYNLTKASSGASNNMCKFNRNDPIRQVIKPKTLPSQHSNLVNQHITPNPDPQHYKHLFCK